MTAERVRCRGCGERRVCVEVSVDDTTDQTRRLCWECVGRRRRRGERAVCDNPQAEVFPPFIVSVWDKTAHAAQTREEAVEIARAALDGWTQDGDRLSWEDRASDTGLPRLVWVCDSVGQPTDAWAAVLRPDSPDLCEWWAARSAASRIEQEERRLFLTEHGRLVVRDMLDLPDGGA